MTSLTLYNKKRNFKVSKEPKGKRILNKPKTLRFVVQEHHASHLHYDFRLEWKGVLKSWAVPKGPEMDRNVKRLAVEVEDHPIEYGEFEGEIPKGEYGGGFVMTWDKGEWLPQGDVDLGLKKGKLEFTLLGEKLSGKWILVRTHNKSKKPNWLLMYRGESEINRAQNFKEVKSHDEVDIESVYSLENLGFIKPQLALLVRVPPQGEQWIHEIKFDGYRIQIHIENTKCTLFTRSGLDWTKIYAGFAKKIDGLKLEDCVLDGELVWVDTDGKMDFQGLQKVQEDRKHQDKLCFYAFDLLIYKKSDLRERELYKRKILLDQHFKKVENNFFKLSEEFKAEANSLLKASCELQLEGIISKNRNSNYYSGRNGDWVKSKCGASQEMIICGFTEPQGNRNGFGALLLGYFDDQQNLIFAGKVGTGFDQFTLRSLYAKLKKAESKSSHFKKPPRISNVHWVKPVLIAEIDFAQWTNDKKLRNPVFKGLRCDKKARSVKKEMPAEINSSKNGSAKNRPLQGRKVELLEDRRSVLEEQIVSHPDKILFKKSGITKFQAANYYLAVSYLIVPYLYKRRAAFLKCPQGTGAKCFLQRHLAQKVEGLKSIDTKDPENSYFYLDSPLGLLSFIQNNGIELHCSNSRVNYEGFADQFIVDFDPDETVPWKEIVQSAYDLKKILDGLHLQSFVKLSGGKGLHVHVPLEPIYTFDQVKKFSHAVCEQLKSLNPDLFVTELSKAKRKGKILLDYLRNSANATAVVPYSLRAKLTDSVALPLEWDELKEIYSPNQFSLIDAIEKIQIRPRDPWQNFDSTQQKIEIFEDQKKPSSARGSKSKRSSSV